MWQLKEVQRRKASRWVKNLQGQHTENQEQGEQLFLEFAAHGTAWQIKRKILLCTPLKGVRVTRAPLSSGNFY
jgi:hypothetical protein